ncbi:MAG TPA: GTP-binding protein [Candidatus Dormibacteraeota bacterium]|nr:GTP-binding protein [Candidatus Dormibacteraeota bacterium]
MARRRRLELILLTGFLGSGKTTLLRRGLSEEGGTGVAVVVNEFADIGLDQELAAGSCGACVLVSGGCACCDRREELLAALRRLLDDSERGVLTGLRSVVIETSGLADPAPIAIAIATDPVLRHHFELKAIVAVVDAIAGVEQVETHPEAKRQVEIADRVVISKTDLAPAGLVGELEGVLSELNPAAIIERAPIGGGSLFGFSTYTPRRPSRANAPRSLQHQHTTAVACLSLTFDSPLDWVAFGVWLSMLLHAHATEMLRVKGIIEASGLGAVAINSVQQVIYPPEHVGDHVRAEQARLVFIARGLEPQSIARSLWAFQHVA